MWVEFEAKLQNQNSKTSCRNAETLAIHDTKKPTYVLYYIRSKHYFLNTKYLY